MAIFQRDEPTSVEATEASRIAIVGGKRLSSRFIDWNFVSSSRTRIEQARRDWQNGVFDGVIGDMEEFIPLPEQEQV